MMRPRSTNQPSSTGAERSDARHRFDDPELFLVPSLSLSVSIGDNSKSQPRAAAQTATWTGAPVPPTVEAGGSGD